MKPDIHFYKGPFPLNFIICRSNNVQSKRPMLSKFIDFPFDDSTPPKEVFLKFYNPIQNHPFQNFRSLLPYLKLNT